MPSFARERNAVWPLSPTAGPDRVPLSREEECLRGWNGSGTIFFSHCSAVAWHPALQSEQVSLLVLDVVDQVPGDRARGTVQPVRFGFSCFNDVYNFAAAAGGQVIRDQGAMAPP